MKNEDVEGMLNKLRVPEPELLMDRRELKIPLLSYRKSSRAGLWLLAVPFTVALTIVLKLELGLQSGYLDYVRKFFAAVDDNAVFTYLIPIIFVGLPLVAMVVNLLAICHFQQNNKERELIITIKYRAVNIFLFLMSFALLVFFLLPDRLSF